MFGQLVRGDERLFSPFSLQFFVFCFNDVMQTQVDVPSLFAATGAYTQPTPTMLRSPRLLMVLEPW